MENRSWKQLGRAILLNVVVLMALLLIFRPCYETSDDIYMNEFASGIMGERENHLVYINYILGSLILGLYNLYPLLNWYAAIHYAAMFLSLVVISYILICEKGNATGTLLAAFISIVFGYQGYVLPQFSKTAGFLVLAGALLIFFAFKCTTPKKKWGKAVVGALLIIFGGMIREQILFLCLLLVLPIGLVEFGRDLFRKGWRCITNYVLIFAVFVGVLGCAQLAFNYHDKQYSKDAEWVNYLEWYGKVWRLIDDFFPYYEDYAQLYEELGISEADLDYYKSWNIADTEKLSTESLSRLVAVKEAYWISPKIKFIKFWSVFPMAFTKISVFPYCALLLIFVVIFSKRKNYLAYFLQMVILFAAYMYMYMTGRVLFNRIDVIVWMGFILGVVYLWEPVNERRFLQFLLSAVLGASVVYVCFTNADTFRWKFNHDWEQKLLTRQEMIAGDQEHLYLCTIDVLGTGVASNPFYVGKEGELSNYYVMGGWTVNTPITNQVLRNYGVENPYRDAIDNDKVYIVDTENPELLERYIQDNYNENAYLELCSNENAIYIYRVITK
jgi:hypothetical protein